MAFRPHTQEELKSFNIIAGNSYLLEYQTKTTIMVRKL